MKYFLILILLCQLSSASNKCDIFLKSVTRQDHLVKLELEADLDTFKIQDPSHKELYLKCTLKADGTLIFDIRKITKDGTLRGDWKASEALDLALKHYGDRVKKINGSWAWGDNLRVFLKETYSGTSEKEAAFKTWTGQQAIKHGFTEIESVSTAEARGKTLVNVIFVKP